MKTVTQLVSQRIAPDLVAAALETGASAARHHRRHADVHRARQMIAMTRKAYGFPDQWQPILTSPDENAKLAKGETPAFGLTLQHHVTTLATGLRVNACPNAGQCVKVCVLDNGKGTLDVVQRARKWRTQLLVSVPFAFFVHLGWEIERAIIRNGEILLRPNVNSDVQWEQVAPALVDGSVFESLKLYGYTKLTDVLYEGLALNNAHQPAYRGDGWITPHYRVAYSWNERSVKLDPYDVEQFLIRGGSVAVVTDRKPKSEIAQWHPWAEVVDADASDEWIFHEGVIGDLSAKGKARKLIRPYGSARPSFVQTVYAVNPARELVAA
jgi:hypothetical protein